MNEKDFSLLLKRLGACEAARIWAKGKDFKTVWETCERGDWMLWLASEMQDETGWSDLKVRTAAKVKCARLVQHLMKDERSLNALDVAERFSRGEATLEEMRIAAYAADAAAYAAYAAAAAAYAAAYAAAGGGAADAARTKVLEQCADICRETLVTPLMMHNVVRPV